MVMPGQSKRTHAALLASATAVATVLSILGPEPLRIAAGVALVLYLPGHAVRRALRLADDDAIVGLVVDVAGSLSCVVALGFLLDALAPGIQRWTLLTAVGLLAGLSCVVDMVRAEAALPHTPTASRRAMISLGLPVVVMVLLAGVAITATRSSALQADQRVKTTELSMTLLPNQEAHVVATDLERAQVRYNLIVRAQGTTLLNRVFVLNSGESWQAQVSTRHLTTGAKVTADLMRRGSTVPYRTVWFDVPASYPQSAQASG